MNNNPLIASINNLFGRAIDIAGSQIDGSDIAIALIIIIVGFIGGIVGYRYIKNN